MNSSLKSRDFLSEQRYKLAFIDNDGTLVRCKSAWHIVHSSFGTLDEEKKLAERYFSQKISYEEFIILSIRSWMSKLGRKIHVNDLLQPIFSKCPMRDDAVELAEGLKTIGIKIVIVSAGIWLLSEKVGREIGADMVLANEVKTDEKGYLTETVSKLVDPRKKPEIIREVADHFNVTLSQTIAIGDSLHDLNMLEMVGIGFLLENKDLFPIEKSKVATKSNVKIVRSLKDVLRHVS